MQNTAGFENPEKIYESVNSLVYRAFDKEKNRHVILKKLNKGYPAPEEVAKFYREYELTSMFKDEGIIQVFEIIKTGSSPSIIMEDIQGISLGEILKSKKISVNLFLDLGIEIINIIGNIHKRNIIHKDINPSNIIWNTERNVIRIIDFGIATELPRELTSVKNPNVFEGTLAYISPEQTGRMNRSLDYRTDFYSLGVTFYYMLTGRLPFESADMLKMVHSHMAVMPVSPHEFDENIPDAISGIVMKLISKNAEDRYQSAYGIKADFEQCRRGLLDTGTINYFVPGLNDVSAKFQIPQKLYGRENEIAELVSAFERVSSHNTELMLVSGFSGVGKSVLINEVQKPIVKHRGYFISGKFEKLKKDVPYSGIIQAFTGFARQILAENRTEIVMWKNKILSALGPNGKIVTDIIPMFELIIGKQPDVPDLGPAESRNRFKFAFQGFIRALADKEHPLAFFLDDLQWADLASLHLMKLFATDSDIKYLFIIGAYRSNDVSDIHPLNLILDEIRDEGTAVNTIFLEPLNAEHIGHLLNDTLNHPSADTESLAQLVIRKTAGNPFFINEFLNFLYKERLFEFSFEKGWSWRMTDIERMQVTENIVDLMERKIAALAEDSQELLKQIACMGSYFNLETLLTINGKPEKNILPALNEILKEGLLNRVDDIYRFSHDRIQEAAYSLISDEEKAYQHYSIGNLELKNTAEEKLHDKIFYIVNHLNAGSVLIVEKSEKSRLAVLNLTAGEKALLSNAYGSALNYFNAGIKLLEDNCWHDDYDFTLKLFREAAIAAQLCADYDTMKKMSKEVLENGRTIFDKIKIYETEIFACIAQNQLIEGIRLGLHVLKKLGINRPEKPGKARIIYELLSLKTFLRSKMIEDLIDLPEMKDPQKLAIMRILTGIATSAYYADPELLPLVIFDTVRFSVKYGNSIYSPYAYAGYGMIHCGILGDIPAGYKWGRLALDLVDKLNMKESKSRVIMVVWFFINHWKRPLNESMIPLLDAYKIALETGELEFAALAAATYSINMFSSGKELAGVEKVMSEFTETVSKFNQDTILTYMRMHYQNVLNLRGETADPCSFSGSSYDKDRMLPLHEKANNISALFYIYFYLLNLNYLFENNTEALKNADLVKPYSDAQISNPYMPVILFYDSLARLALYPGENKTVQKKYMSCVIKNQKKMKKWSLHAPESYSHKYYLVEAEIARVKKDDKAARKNYKLAVKLARENEFLNEEALALKLTAKFWIELNEKKIAALYMTEAYRTYNMWGAKAVVKHIEKKYGNLLRLHKDEAESAIKKTDTGTTGSSDVIDLSTVIKTSQTISGEVDISRLLETIMKLSIENAGAQRGFLIIINEENQNLYIEAEGEPGKDVRVTGSVPVENNGSLSSTIVNYVNRTGESVVLGNAFKEGSFRRDSYITENKIKSLLCMPITYKGKTSGILYLENNITVNVFTTERLKLLQILSSQAAISFDNARLMIHRENKAKLEKEIEMAEKIQRSLLPANIPEIKEVRVAFKYIPMMGVGGDFVNIFYKKDESKIGLFICDVSGHGVYAAMIASMVSNALDFFWAAYFESPSTILKEMGNFLKGKMGGNFLTGCLCSIDLKTGLLIMSNAGHPPLMLLKKNGDVELKITKGRFISEYFEPDQENSVFKLDIGDRIILYTDGITEAQDSSGEQIGADDIEFCEWVKSINEISSTPDALCGNIYNGVVEYTGTDQLDDDFTILVLEFMG